MHAYSFIAAGFVAAAFLLAGSPPAVARAEWALRVDTGRHNAAPEARITPPGPFLQINPDPYLYPQPSYSPPQPQYRQPSPGHASAWQQQSQERQWRESQWQDRQREGYDHPDWRDWSQHDRSDRMSREREGRDRDWRDRRDQENRTDRNPPAQSGNDAARNGPNWGYREYRH